VEALVMRPVALKGVIHPRCLGEPFLKLGYGPYALTTNGKYTVQLCCVVNRYTPAFANDPLLLTTLDACVLPLST